ncbi:VOC family protein [Neobacillus sp. PS3-40]|uniref:VOC family protein n=1 Tax=Neobacillus sp. PS3-40 TaxID=3070679 RepID=UPI0027E1F7E8|nr:VOC family protein [Neobacillus sp. PS3-40]WML42430.1 VOC family protein [Neobacillus sp. PS3-40]
MTTNLIPFLEMNGKAKEAIELYVKGLDAEVVSTLLAGDAPWNAESQMSVEMKELIQFAILKVGDSELRLSDFFTGSSYEKGGTQMTICITTEDKAKATQFYEALKQDGYVHEALKDSPFSPAYATVTDKFGVTFKILTVVPR